MLWHGKQYGCGRQKNNMWHGRENVVAYGRLAAPAPQA